MLVLLRGRSMVRVGFEGGVGCLRVVYFMFFIFCLFQLFKIVQLILGRCFFFVWFSLEKGKFLEKRFIYWLGQGGFKQGRVFEILVFFIGDFIKEIFCYEGQIFWDSLGSLGFRVFCFSFCFLRIREWVFVLDYLRLQVFLILDCKS